MSQDHLAFRKHARLRRQQATGDELAGLVDELLSRWDHDREEIDRRINRLTENLRALDSRLLLLENSHVLRMVQKTAGYFRMWAHKGQTYVRPAQAAAEEDRAYQLWLERQQSQQASHAWFRDTAANFEYQPRLSLLLCVERPLREQLVACVQSVLTQLYSHWELAVVDDANAEPWIAPYFEDLSARDPRIQYVRSERPMGEVSSLNRAGMLVNGDYVGCLAQHDQLRPDALFRFTEALQTERVDLLYSDQDSVSQAGIRERPSFRPGWSPDLLLASLYIGQFFLISRARLNALEWFRTDLDGAHLSDLVLRLAEQSPTVRHVARVLYSSQPAAVAPHRRAVEQAIERRSVTASLEQSGTGSLVIRRKLSGTPLASIIICSRTARLLKTCLRAIDAQTAYPVRETVVVQHRTGDDAAMDRLLARSHCIRVSHAGPFDFSAMNNRGAQASNGDVLVFLNDDVEPLSADWLKELSAQLQRPEVGIVGARLLYPSGAIQHAGMAIGMMDGAGHPQRGTMGRGFWPWAQITRNVSAVTGACLAIRRTTFEKLGGFDLRFPVNYNDVDLCLRARQNGYEVICETNAVLRHLESKTRLRGVTWQERELFYERWGHLLEQGDPYYNANLTRTKEDCSLLA
ncbi:MAG: glycosyltransferase [Acidobacteriaceae bacterium]|nr:glycosyltransferase [Acidobacteriaceae bacterium]